MNGSSEVAGTRKQAYLAEAHAKGISFEDLVLQDFLLARQLSPSPDPNKLPLDEWMRRFNAWVESHAGNTVVLPDAAMERESIYGGHGR